MADTADLKNFLVSQLEGHLNQQQTDFQARLKIHPQSDQTSLDDLFLDSQFELTKILAPVSILQEHDSTAGELD